MPLLTTFFSFLDNFRKAKKVFSQHLFSIRYWLGAVLLVGLGPLLTQYTVAQDNPPLQNTQPLTLPLIPPEKAVEMIRLPEGFSASLFAAEPEIRQPIAITTDGRGRIWVAECVTYAELERDFDMRYSDRILIFEDTDGDGQADKRTIFWEGGKRLTSIEVGNGGVYVTCAPHFMFIPDADGNDVPDGQPEILLDGWNSDFIRHNIVNGLKWGPDGWLYGRHGILATSFVGPPGATDSQRTALNSCMWRFHPITREFEVVCEGTINPWGHDWDQHGELFMINTVIGHLWHVVPGARYRRVYGSHFNPYTYETIEQTADHFHFSRNEHWNDVNSGMSDETDRLGGGHAHCGMMIYQGDNWPDEYRGQLFTANFHGRRLNRESLHRQGNGYVGKHEKDFMFTDDIWFRGVEMIYGPDGGVYLLDWSDIGECHDQDGVHRTSGRVYKIVYGETNKSVDCNLESKTNEELFALFDHKNQWFVRTAHRLLRERALKKEQDRNEIVNRIQTVLAGEIKEQSSEQPSFSQLYQTMWLHHAINYPSVDEADAVDDTGIVSWLRHDNEHVRATVVKLLSDRPSQALPQKRLQLLLDLAHNDKSSLVRLHLASAMRRMTPAQRIEMAIALAGHGEDAGDRAQAKLIWYNVEPAIVSNSNRAMQLAGGSKLPHLSHCIYRRLGAEATDHPEFLVAMLELAGRSKADAIAILPAMQEALNGRRKVPAPENWESTVKLCGEFRTPEIDRTLAFLGAIFGNGVSTAQLKQIASNLENDVAVRRQAIKAYAQAKPEGLFETLRDLLYGPSVLVDDPVVSAEVVRALAYCSEPEVASLILVLFEWFDAETKRSAIATLCTRGVWAKELLQAIGAGRIQRNELNAANARQIKGHGDDELNELLAEHWGVVKETPEELAAKMSEIRALVERDDIAPDMANGAKLFSTNCASCHVLNGVGGNRGPDLTGSDRQNISYLLENIIAPSSSVADTYRSSVLKLEDGRTLVGVITEESPTTLKLLMVDEEVVIEINTIEGRRNTQESLMPTGLLDKLSEQEIVDLFGYLRK